MQFVVKRDILLKSLNYVQGVVEKKILYQYYQTFYYNLKIANYQLLQQI